MYFSDTFQIEEISINKNDYELLKFLTVDCMCFCSKRELLALSILQFFMVLLDNLKKWNKFEV
jgi:hypothetical protein